MPKLTIIGNSTPEIGTQNQYSIVSLGFNPVSYNNPLSPQKPTQAEWNIYVMENGKWRKTSGNTKYGDTAPYTFTQKSLTRKGIKLKVIKGEDYGELVLKPTSAKNPKIIKIELLDINGNKVIKPLSYADTLVAKAYCTDMDGQVLHFTLWEDDAAGPGHNPINEKNKINIFPISGTVKKGIAEARFNMAQYTMASIIANMQIAKGDRDEGKTHEYYVTAEYFGKLEASNNVNLKNPAYNPSAGAQKPAGNGSTKPKNTPNKNPVTAPAPKKETYKVPVTAGSKTKTPDAKGKIIKVSFVDGKGNPVTNFKTSQGVIAKIETQNMVGKSVKLTIWEEDTISNDEIWSELVKITKDVCYKGIPITDKMWGKGDDGGDSTTQEYFLEVEYAGDEIKSGVVTVDKNAPRTKTETGKSMQSVGKIPKEKFDKVVGLGKEAVLYITCEIATEIVVDKNDKIISYPDYGGYNGMDEYKEGNKIYTKKLPNGTSAFPLYKMYVYRGNKIGEAIQKLKQDIENKTYENSETTVLTVARHAQKNNKNYGDKGPLPPNTLKTLYRLKYKHASNDAGKESYRYRIVENNSSNFPISKDLKNEVENGSMTIGSRGSISIDPWKSKDLIGCVGIRNSDGTNHSSCAGKMTKENINSTTKYKFIYHSLNNYLENIIPELTGIYGRRGYSYSGDVNVKSSDYKEEIKVYVLVDPLPEINNCKCTELKKDGRKEYYDSFGAKVINYVSTHTSANKFKGLYMIAQRRQENGFNLKTPLNNPMNIKGSGDAGKKNMSTHETYDGNYKASVESFANFTSEEAGFNGYIDLLKRNFPDAYNALNDNSKTIDNFVIGLEDTGKKGAYATGKAEKGMTATQQYKAAVKDNFASTLKDYKKMLECKLCKTKDEKEKTEIKQDIELLNQLK